MGIANLIFGLIGIIIGVIIIVNNVSKTGTSTIIQVMNLIASILLILFGSLLIYHSIRMRNHTII